MEVCGHLSVSDNSFNVVLLMLGAAFTAVLAIGVVFGFDVEFIH